MILQFVAYMQGRSWKWPKVEHEFLDEYKECEGCGCKHDLVGHHIVPFHVDRSKELDKANLVAVCNWCHYVLCHMHEWSCWNPDCRETLRLHRIDVENRKFA